MLKFLELVVVLFGFLCIWTQIVLPAIKGKQFFPMFRRERELSAELQEANQKKEEALIEKEIEKVEKETTKIEKGK
jgi:hypothetical protein